MAGIQNASSVRRLFRSRLGGFHLLKVDHWMAGTLLPLAGFSEETMYIVPLGCRQLVFDAPHFLEHQIAPPLGGRFIWGLIHIIRLKVVLACR